MANIEKYSFFGIPDGVTIDRTPIPLDDATRQLCERAVADPSSITDSEMRSLTLRPPPEQEDELCREQCGIPFREVIEKALRHEKLNFDEAEVLKLGVMWEHKSNVLPLRMRQTKDDQELRSAAVEAVTPQPLKDARVIAQPVYAEAVDAQSEAVLRYYQGFEELHFRRAHSTPWQKHILQQGNGGACGLVLFYPASEATQWAEFNAKMNLGVHHGLRAIAGGIKEPIMEKFRLHLIENKDGKDRLQERFKQLRDEGAVPAGLRTDAFLYVDDEALASINKKRPFLWLWEPDDTEHGPLMVGLNYIMPLLMARLTQRDFEGEARTKPFRFGPDLGDLHCAAKYARSEEDKLPIWPPTPRAT